MSNTSFGFSVEQDDVPAVAYEQLPDGKYPFQLAEAQRKASKNDPANWYIEAKFKVIAGNFVDKTHIHRFFVGNAKEDTKNRALNEIKGLAKAVGYAGKLGSLDFAFGKPFCAEIKGRPGKDQDGNDRVEAKIAGYYPISSYSAAPAVNVGLPPSSTATSSAAGVAPPNTGNGPWGGQQAAPWPQPAS